MRLILAACSLAAAAAAHAAQPLITEDTGTQGEGRWQLEGQTQEAKERATRRSVHFDQLTLARGIAGTVDLQLGVPWYSDGPDGVGDLAVEMKWRFHERDALSFALMPSATLPTGSKNRGRGNGKLGYGALLIASWQPGPLALHGHFGLRRNRNEVGERESLNELAAAATYQLGSLQLVGELARATDPVRGARAERYTTLGVIWSVTRDFDLDAGWREGRGGAPIDDVLLIGATVRW